MGGFGPWGGGYSPASAAFLLVLHMGEGPLCSVAVLSVLGGFQLNWDSHLGSLWRVFLCILLAEAVS